MVKRSKINPILLVDIERKKCFIQRQLVNWCKDHYRSFPWRENRTAYSILVAEVLLKRTTATAVNDFYPNFLATYPDIKTLTNADPQKLEKTLSKLGYQKCRSRIFIEIANFIITNYKGKIPKSKIELLAIPHVGEYTANAVLTFAYGVPTAILDTNVERILRRVFQNNAPKATTLEPYQEIANLIMPEVDNQLYNYALLDLGGTVCVSGIPRCYTCPIQAVCDYSSHNCTY